MKTRPVGAGVAPCGRTDTTKLTVAFHDFAYAPKKAGNLGNKAAVFLISSFRRVLHVVCFLLANSPASRFYMPTFRNTMFHLHRQVDVSKAAFAGSNPAEDVGFFRAKKFSARLPSEGK